MAPSAFILMTLFSQAMVTGMAEARMALVSEYKNMEGVDKEVAVVEAIDHLVHGESTTFSGENIKDCHTTSNNLQNNDKVFVRDFEPRPSASAFPDDAVLEGYHTTFKNAETHKELVKDFEPRPNLSVYQD